MTPTPRKKPAAKKTAARKTVLITGAGGNLGGKLRRHLEETGSYDLRLFARTPREDPSLITADLTVYDETWARHFEGVDTVVHLAAAARAWSGWDLVVPNNIDMILNIGHAAVKHGVRRIVFGSSNWVVAGHRFSDVPLTPDMPPRPVNPYGASKLFAERYGRHLASREGISFIVLRIGWCQVDPENLPETATRWGRWGRDLWLSNRDFCQVVEKAINVKDVPFAILNATSANPGTRWDLSETKRVLGYEPQDGVRVPMPLSSRVKQAVRRAQCRLFGEASQVPFTELW